VNLNSHILLALAVAMALFHRVDLAILVGIGAAIPDLDREYVFTRRKFSELISSIGHYFTTYSSWVRWQPLTNTWVLGPSYM